MARSSPRVIDAAQGLVEVEVEVYQTRLSQMLCLVNDHANPLCVLVPSWGGLGWWWVASIGPSRGPQACPGGTGAVPAASNLLDFSPVLCTNWGAAPI